MLVGLIAVCRARKADYRSLRDRLGREHPETCYARGVYFGLLVALREANGGQPVRI